MDSGQLPKNPPKIIVGLGNPGSIYRDTRHNVGFIAIDALAGPGAVFNRKGLSLVLRGKLAGFDVVFAKPQTYMNRSGEAIAHLLNENRCAVSDLVVIYDDAEIPFGNIRIRQRGSHAGHNGMKSITREVGTSEVARVRVGIGRSGAVAGLADHVLQEFAADEQQKLPLIFKAVGEAIGFYLGGQVGKAMSLFNRRDVGVDQIVSLNGSGRRAGGDAKASAPPSSDPSETSKTSN